jgi:hypothetical protein
VVRRIRGEITQRKDTRPHIWAPIWGQRFRSPWWCNSVVAPSAGTATTITPRFLFAALDTTDSEKELDLMLIWASDTDKSNPSGRPTNRLACNASRLWSGAVEPMRSNGHDCGDWLGLQRGMERREARLKRAHCADHYVNWRNARKKCLDIGSLWCLCLLMSWAGWYNYKCKGCTLPRDYTRL